MPAPDLILELVERFEHNREDYRSGKYNEAQLRQEFLNPFFECLGWDVYNKNGYALDYREVIHEDSVAIEGAAKAPDYAFKIGKERKFFVEAKKPAVNIQYDIYPAYQLRRYAWNVRLPLGILTDFEEFAVYDCRDKPHPGDSAGTARVMFLNYTQYLEKWDQIAAVFSRQAVLKGSFDQYAAGVKGKKGTLEVDDAFLAEIERWRELLARNIALRNPGLTTEHTLNYAVQMTIDRIIFLRICEDRGVEPEEQLRQAAKTPGVYEELLRLFKKADMKYNSGLFHFSTENSAEPGQVSPADAFTPALKIDDKALKDILTSIYYPCPYIFKEIPVEILGQVYERFLGKVIRLTPGGQAKIEEKPAVRKAGGVYYTPTYIVNYIVQHTVGKLLEGKTPEQVSSLRIIDPACGSGSFLLGAYQCLLDWHLGWYSEHDPEKWAKGKLPPLCQAAGGGWRLTTAEKKLILLNNLFGVDIDQQAVEVTRLSLLLKTLEGESGQLSLGLQRALPDLGRNIQCGNSLIGSDYYSGRQMELGLVDEQERYRVNAFDWQTAFPQVFAAGGFDAVIGNPPYVRQESLSEFKEYFQTHYHSYDGVADLYVYFIEKGLSILREGGLFSIIVSSSFLRATYGKALRSYLSQNGAVLRIVDFGGLAIFENAKDTYVCIPLLSRTSPNQHVEVCKVKALTKLDLQRINLENHYDIPISQLTPEAWYLDNPVRINIFQKIMSQGISLRQYSNDQIYYGIKTGLNEAFIIDSQIKERLISQDQKSTELIKPLLQGEDIRRWSINYKNLWIIFTRRGINIDAYPAIKEYLLYWKDDLAPKQFKGQKRGRKPGIYKWYEIQDDVAYYQAFDGVKIIYPDIAKGPRFYLDESGNYLANTAYAIGMSDLYLLGILNSKLFWFTISNISIPFGIRGGEYRYRLIHQYMENVPIHPIDFSDAVDKSRHDQMVALVERMLALHQQHPLTPHEQELRQREIAATDAQIDALVYELYGLTGAEIQIIEGAGKT